MNQTSAYINASAIKARHAPYHTMREFAEGFAAYQKACWMNPYIGVRAQAWDRGLDAAREVARQSRWIEENVGAN
jgi:hypothetical protein